MTNEKAGRQSSFGILHSAFFVPAREWAVGRSWPWRAILLLYLAYVGVRHLSDPLYTSLFGGLTLGIHELGHLILRPLGDWPGVAGGSLAQLVAPIAAGAIFFRQRDYFAISVAGAWLAFSLWGLATYIGDARAQELPLLALGPDPIHDWNWMLAKLGLLDWDKGLAFLTRLIATLTWVGAMTFGGWLVWLMAARRSVH